MRPGDQGGFVTLSGPTAVLLYHRVAAPSHDTHRLSVHPDRFAAQVDHLRRHERVVPLHDVCRRSIRRRVVVTFDDGYADNALVAAPILERAGVPATFFVTADLVGSTDGSWWDELERVVLGGRPIAAHLRVEVDGKPLVADVRTDEARARAHLALHRRIVACELDVIDRVIAQVRVQMEVPDGTAGGRFMTAEELRGLARDRFEIGSHGLTHRQLAALDATDQRHELVASRAALEAATGEAVTTVAYPFGGPGTFDATTERLAAEAGYRLGCANQPGLAGPRTPRFRVPRFVVRDWTVDELAARLDAWFRHRAV